jgi:hypothetical protein
MTHAAIIFLHALDPSPGAKFNVESYTDGPKGAAKPKPDLLISRRAGLSLGEVASLIPTLEELNAQGAGIFVAVNECSGHRSKASVARVRCIHADLDGVQITDRERLRACLEPSIEVQTSGPDNQHWYWVLEGGEELAVADAEHLNKQLVGYGGDPAAVDASRLLRLPGFMHMKYRSSGQTPVVETLNIGASHTVAALMTAFAPHVARARPTPPSVATSKASGGTWAELEEAVRSAHPVLWAGDWSDPVVRWRGVPYDSQSQADLALAGYIARECARSRVPRTQWPAAVETVFGRSMLADRSKWQDREDYRHATIEKALEGVTEPQEELLDPNSHGDIRNAKAFALRAVDRLLYITTRDRWLIWK